LKQKEDNADSPLQNTDENGQVLNDNADPEQIHSLDASTALTYTEQATEKNEETFKNKNVGEKVEAKKEVKKEEKSKNFFE
jgi:hypothetical protein